ncbi:MAG: divergent PAP2 family protein [Bacillota bacterium]
MPILNITLFSLFIAQLLKVFSKKPFDFNRIVGSGGMPSSHASFVSTLSTIIGLKYGFNSDFFAVVVVFSLIIIYDASGVRRSVGKQANVLNHLLKNLDLTSINKEKKVIKADLKELVGHTPFEVFAGTGIGIIIALIYYYLF